MAKNLTYRVDRVGAPLACGYPKESLEKVLQGRLRAAVGPGITQHRYVRRTLRERVSVLTSREVLKKNNDQDRNPARAFPIVRDRCD